MKSIDLSMALKNFSIDCSYFKFRLLTCYNWESVKKNEKNIDGTEENIV